MRNAIMRPTGDKQAADMCRYALRAIPGIEPGMCATQIEFIVLR
jgi:hypothetical protein